MLLSTCLLKGQTLVYLREWEESIFLSDRYDDTEFVMHYTSVERAAAIALTQSLVLSPLRVLNDPRESQQRQSIRVTYSIPGGPVMPDVADDVGIQHDAALWALRNQVRVGCFTADARAHPRGTGRDADERGFARPRMWAQYGAGHAGCCLVMNREALESAARGLSAKVHCGRVRYVEGVDLALHEAELVELNDPTTGRTGPDLTKQQRAMVKSLFSKNADWATEREFRIVVEDWKDERPEAPRDR